MPLLRNLSFKIGLDGAGDIKSKIKDINDQITDFKDKFGPAFAKIDPTANRAAVSLDKLSQTFVDANGRLRNLNGTFAATKITDEFEAAAKSAGYTNREISKLQFGLDKAKQEAQTFKTVMATIGGIGLSAIVGSFASKTLSVGIKFEAEMSQVQAATNGTKEQLKELSLEARRLGATTTFSATEAAQAMTELAKAGLNNKEIMVGTNAVLQLAGAGGLGLAEATTIASDTMSGFGLKAEDMGKISDVLAKGANASTISVQMMGETFKYVSGVAKAANVSLEETAAMTAILGNAGIKGSMAGTTLKTMLIQLSSPSKEAAGLINRLGIETKDASGNMLPISNIIGSLQKATDKMGNTKKIDILSTIFGSEPAAGVIALLDKGKNGIDEMTLAMKNSSGSAAKFSKIANANIQGLLKSLSSIMEEIQLKIFDVFAPAITTFLSFFTDADSGMARTTFVLGLLATAIGVGLVLAAKHAMVAGYAMLAPYAPFIAIALGIASALSILYLIFEDIYIFFEYGREGSNTFFGDMLAGIGVTEEEMQGLHLAFKEFKRILGVIGDFFVSVWQSKLGTAIKWLLGILVGLLLFIPLLPFTLTIGFAVAIGFISARWNWLMSLFRTVWNSTIDFMLKAAIVIGKTLIIILFPIAALYIFRNEIFNFFEMVLEKIKNLDFIKSFIQQFYSLKEKLADILSNVFAGAKETFRNLLPVDTINSVIDSINYAYSKVADFSKFAHSSFSSIPIIPYNPIPHLQQRELGGPVESGVPYLVGEKGPEIRVFNRSGSIIPNSELNSSGRNESNSSSSPVNFNFQVTIFGENSESIANDLWSAMKSKFADNEDEIRAMFGVRIV